MDYDDDYEDLNSYSSGSSSYEGEDWEKHGFSIDDATENREQSAEELLAMYGEDIESPNPEMGMATAETLLLGRLEPLSIGVRETFYKALRGELKGAHGYSDDDLLQAVKTFEAESGVSAIDFASKMKVIPQEPIKHLTRQGKDIPYDKVIPSSASRSDMNVVLSMLGTTAGSYLSEGPGAKLAGNVVNNEARRRKNESDLEEAYGNISEIAEFYIRDETRGTKEYNNRKYKVTEALTERFMNMHFYEPSEYGPDRSLLPEPNNLWLGNKRITGLVETVSHFGRSTQHTAITASYEADSMTEEELAMITPNLRKSLFPLKGKQTDIQKALHRRDSQEQLDELYEKSEFIRKTFKKSFPTNRDESLQQGRNFAFDKPYGDQSERSNLVNEALLMGLSQDASDLEGLSAEQVREHGRGSDRGGMYGNKGLSEVGEFIEYSQLSKEDSFTYDKYSWQAGHDPEDTSDPVFDDTDLGRYKRWVYQTKPAKQGDEAWKEARRGLVTASTASDLSRNNGRIAASLAAQRLDVKDEFSGNSWTKDGNDAEAGVIAAFRGSEYGKGLVVEEAYFEPATGDLEGIVGVSPDGRVYKPDGTSDGLLEVKYLTNSSLKSSKSDHIKQMQLQMLSTGETQVHYFRQSSDDNHIEYDLIKADSAVQHKLKQAAISAHKQAASVTKEDIEVMREKLHLDTAAAKPKPSSTLAGPEAEFKVAEEVPYTASAFDPNIANAVQATGSTVTNAAINKALANQLKGQGDPVIPLRRMDAHIQDYNVNEARTKEAKEEAREVRRAQAEADKLVAEAKKAEADAAKKAADELSNFTIGLKSAITNLGKLGSAMMAGTESGMGEVQLAARTGLDASKVRRIRESLVESGLSEAGATSTISSAGDIQAKFGNAITSAQEYTRLLKGIGTSNLPGVRDIELPSQEELERMNPQELIAMWVDKVQGKTKEERSAIARLAGMLEIAISDGRSSVLGSDPMLDEPGLRGSHEGGQLIKQTTREVGEFLGSGGEFLGTIAAGAAVVGGSIGLLEGVKGANYFKNHGMKGVQTFAGKASSTLKSIPKVGGALAVAPTVVRAATGIDDGDGVGDSLLDIADWATWGATAGAAAGVLGNVFAPVTVPVGTAVGAAVGTAVGIGNEIYEYLDRDISPSTAIGPMSDPILKADKSDTVNNIEVNVTVDRDLVRTEVNANGDLDTDEEATNSTGGY